MDMFEKVEKLRERANVSYEDAKAALEQANGDILDAMIILEKQGKTSAPKSESYSTNYEDNRQSIVNYNSSEKSGNSSKEKVKDDLHSFGEKIKKIFDKSCVNYLVVEKNGEKIVSLPIIAAILIILLTWYVSLILIVVSLFFGFNYRFEGEDNMKAANDVMDKAEDVANQVKEKVVEEYNKL